MTGGRTGRQLTVAANRLVFILFTATFRADLRYLGDRMMELSFTEDQALLRDSVAQAFRRVGDGEQAWSLFAQMGLLGQAVNEDLGGSGQGVLEACIVAEQIGRAGIVAPFSTNAIAAAYLLQKLGDEQQKQLLEKMVSGTLRIAIAAPSSRPSRQVRADRGSNGSSVLTGEILVPEIDDVELIILRASTDEGMRAFLVEIGDLGDALTTYAGIDGSTEATAILDSVKAQPLGASQDCSSAFETAIDRSNMVICAELIGLMSDLVDRTRDYLKTRTQFGQPLATKQVLRHRLVDMAVAVEEAQSLMIRAALALDDLADIDARRAASGAVIKVGAAALYVAEDAVQLHGAMGTTDELGIGARLKRVIAAKSLMGGRVAHLKRHAALAG